LVDLAALWRAIFERRMALIKFTYLGTQWTDVVYPYDLFRDERGNVMLWGFRGARDPGPWYNNGWGAYPLTLLESLEILPYRFYRA
jgi:hypothetical protein